MEFAGFEITPDSVRPSEKFLQAIERFPVPTDITGVRSWFGLINQVSYAYSLTKELEPFRELLKPRNKFYWDESLDKIFRESKASIVENVKNGVRIFNPDLKTCLTTDWSKTGSGFILSQKHCTCTNNVVNCCAVGWKIVFAGSKFNNKTEMSYAPIEGECLAVVRALFKARYFVLGCTDLTVVTDHKPLIKVLGDRSLEDIHNPRLLNLKEKTLRYSFKIVHISGKKNAGADAISRYPSEPSSSGDFEDGKLLSQEADLQAMNVAISSLSSIDNLTVTSCDTVKNYIKMDESMVQLQSLIQNGFQETIDQIPEAIREYHKFRGELTCVNGLILYKTRVVIPRALRGSILDNLHSAHQGVTSMLARAESSVFWPGITSDIRLAREKCVQCNKMAPSQPSAPPTPLVYPEYPFQHICADFFTYKGVNYAVIIDRYSNWPAVLKAKHGGTAKELINAIKAFCETFGIPEELSSDGGPQFSSGEMRNFLKDWDIRHRVSSTAFPHSNCRAELGVKTMKRLITENVGPQGSIDVDRFRRAMLQYKNTPDPDTKLSPAQIIFGRSIRDFTPASSENYKQSSVWVLSSEMREQALAKRHALQRERLAEHTRRLPPLKVGDHVYVQNQVGNYPRKWDRSGVVVEVKGFDQYNIKVDGSGRLTLRNRKFLRKFTPFLPTHGSTYNPNLEDYLRGEMKKAEEHPDPVGDTGSPASPRPDSTLSSSEQANAQLQIGEEDSRNFPQGRRNASGISQQRKNLTPHHTYELRSSTRPSNHRAEDLPQVQRNACQQSEDNHPQVQRGLSRTTEPCREPTMNPPQVLRRSTRIKRPNTRYADYDISLIGPSRSSHRGKGDI